LIVVTVDLWNEDRDLVREYVAKELLDQSPTSNREHQFRV
jgi:hypothetical protein